MVERDGLENRCSPRGYRGFESLPLRSLRPLGRNFVFWVTSGKGFPQSAEHFQNAWRLNIPMDLSKCLEEIRENLEDICESLQEIRANLEDIPESLQGFS